MALENSKCSPLSRDHAANINPLKLRENPRYFDQAMFDLRSVQRGREISEDEVIAVNHVLKSSAKRYIASAEQEWLYPENRLKERFWSKIGGPLFLRPDPRKMEFSTTILVGYKDGAA